MARSMGKKRTYKADGEIDMLPVITKDLKTIRYE